MDTPTPVAIRLRRSIPDHDAYTVRLADRRFTVLATARPSDARRWVATTRWLHHLLLFHGRLVVGLGVQWTPTRRPLGGAPPLPATLQLCVRRRCLVFHLAQADAVPEALRRFLADPRVTFVGSGSANDCRMLWAHYGLRVACGRELRAMAGMGNVSMEEMADRFLGYPGITKSRDVAMSAWHAPRLSMDQVLYAAVDAFLAFRLGVHLCPDGAADRQPEHVHQAPPARVRPPGPVPVRPAPPAHVRPVVLNSPLPPGPRGPVLVRPAPTAHRALPRVECSPRALCGVAILAPADVDAANPNSKVVDTGAGMTESDTDTDYDSDMGDAATHGFLVRAYASDSEDDDDYSSDGFEHARFGAFTDDEEEDEDDGSVTDLGVHEDDQEDEDAVCSGLGTPCVDDHEEDEYAEIGILTVEDNSNFTSDGVVTANVDEEDGGGCAFEHLGDSEAVLDDGEDALGQDDWNDQEDYGCDDLDDDDTLDEFYLLL